MPRSACVRTHTTTATDPHRRGLDLGQACAEQVRETWRRYRELWWAFSVSDDEVRDVGAAVLGPIEAFSAELRAELAGIAAGAGLAPWQVGALNARSELLALGDQRLRAADRLPGSTVSECSTLVRLPDRGPPLTAQTWDWHTPLRDSWFVWTLRLPTGRTVRTLTEYGIVGKIGVAVDAEAGRGAGGAARGAVGVHFNALRHRDDTGTGGVPVHLVARRVLDEARSTEDAVAIARAAPTTASAAVTVTAPEATTGHWTACSLELHPGGPAVLPAGRAASTGWLAHTNHFVSDQVPPGSDAPAPTSTSPERLARVTRLARTKSAGAGGDAAQAAAEELASHDLGPRSVCVHGFPDAPLGQRTATLAVAVAEPAAGRLHVHAGRPCDARPDGWWTGG